MKPTFIKYLFIFSGAILVSFINPVLSYSQLASEDFVYGDALPERALRDATPERSRSPYPILIVSHGYVGSRDLRIKAVVAFAPWEMKCGTWDSEGLKGLKIPTFFVTGSMDDISGYENGTKAVCNRAVNCERYLFTYVNARHNVAPNPPPKESLEEGLPFDFYYHYAEPAWDLRRINNINNHFVTAFMEIHLKNLDYEKYFKAAEGKDIKT